MTRRRSELRRLPPLIGGQSIRPQRQLGLYGVANTAGLNTLPLPTAVPVAAITKEDDMEPGEVIFDAWTIIGTENGPVVLRGAKALMRGEYITVFEKPPKPPEPEEVWIVTNSISGARRIVPSDQELELKSEKAKLFREVLE